MAGSWAIDVVPLGHSVFGPAMACEAPEEDAEEILLYHRNISLPFARHTRGPRCLCAPVAHQRSETWRPGFWNEIRYPLAGAVN